MEHHATRKHGGQDKQRSARIAHKMPGRIRIQLDRIPTSDEKRELTTDLMLSPEVSKVRINGRSLVIEHDENRSGSFLQAVFPGLQSLSDKVDEAVAKGTEMPEVNKLLPLGFLALAVFKGFRDSAFFAGESSFALAYIAFDLYWKFQQENVTRKIHEGMTKSEQQKLEKAS